MDDIYCHTAVSILDVLVLPREVHDACENGQLTYREKPGTLNSIWTDMGVKKAVIRSDQRMTKMSLGWQESLLQVCAGHVLGIALVNIPLPSKRNQSSLEMLTQHIKKLIKLK